MSMESSPLPVFSTSKVNGWVESMFMFLAVIRPERANPYFCSIIVVDFAPASALTVPLPHSEVAFTHTYPLEPASALAGG